MSLHSSHCFHGHWRCYEFESTPAIWSDFVIALPPDLNIHNSSGSKVFPHGKVYITLSFHPKSFISQLPSTLSFSISQRDKILTFLLYLLLLPLHLLLVWFSLVHKYKGTPSSQYSFNHCVTFGKHILLVKAVTLAECDLSSVTVSIASAVPRSNIFCLSQESQCKNVQLASVLTTVDNIFLFFFL